MGMFASQDTQEEAGAFASGIPSYLVAADNHSFANGQGTILDPTTWGQRGSNVAKFTMSAMTRAITSAWNVIPSTANWLGGSFETVDTYDVLQKFDEDLGQYYANNQRSVDVVGDIVGSFVPGMAGVKLLNYGQKALRGMSSGGLATNMARSIGLLATKSDSYAKLAAAEAAANTSTFSYINANTIKALAAGYGQGALEMAAFEVAATTAMRDSPIFESHTASDIIANSLYGGGLLGAGILGTATGIQTYFKISRAGKEADIALKPFTARKDVEAGLPAHAKLLTYLDDAHSMPQPANDIQTRLATQKLNNIQVATRGVVNDMLLKPTDTQVGTLFTDAIWSLNPANAENMVAGLAKVSRANEAAAALAGTGKKAVDALDVKYLNLSTGEMTVTAPPVLRFADGTAERVGDYAKTSHIRNTAVWNPLVAADHFEVEARYIAAAQFKDMVDDIVIGSHDLPYLEKAAVSEVRNIKLATEAGLINVTKADLPAYITRIKEEMMLQLVDDIRFPTTHHIAKVLNVPVRTLEAEVTGELADYTARSLRDDTAWMRPDTLKLQYSKDVVKDIDGNILRGMAAIKQQQILQQEAIDRVIATAWPEDFAKLIPITDRDILLTTREGAGAGILNAASGNYLSPAAKMEYLGKLTNAINSRDAQINSDLLVGTASAIIGKPAASAEVTQIYQLLRQTPEQYVLAPDGRTLVNREILRHQREVEAGVKNPRLPNIMDTKAPETISLQSEEVATWVKNWIARNDTQLTNRYNMLGVSGKAFKDNRGVMYVPPPDPKKFKHFAFVIDDSVTDTGHVSMIWAASPEELSALASKVPTQDGLKVIFKDQSEAFFKARRDYDYNLGINENYINSALWKSGVSASYFPKTDAATLMQELHEWRNSADRSLNRDLMTLKYSRQFQELKHLGDQYTSIATSTTSGIRKYAEETVQNPYVDMIKTALDIPRSTNLPAWGKLNELAESGFSKVIGKLQDSWKSLKNPQQLEELNSSLRQAGIRGPFQDAATELYANHSAGQAHLSRFVNSANSIAATFMLRTDPLNAVNNGIGSLVLTGSETSYLIKAIAAKNADAVGELAALGSVKLPGVDQHITSPAKLIARAYKSWFSKVLGDADAGALRTFFNDNGWLPSFVEQQRLAFDAISLRGTETASQLSGKLRTGFEATADFMEKVTGNRAVEEMNRYVSAHIAKEISDVGIKHGVIGAKEQLAFINTFVNRTQGNYLASQRPLLFQGPLGQSIGLFMTYQLNLMQHVFRYVGEGHTKQLALLGALQGSIYGMNGLPAFNAINTYLVGNAYGNTAHKDIVTATYDAAGKEAGDWMLYGFASNMFLHPDLKVNLYTRGDINPRHATVIPTSFADVPAVGIATQFFTSLFNTASKLGDGAPVASTILQGIEHAGISRPLAGLAVTAQGFTNEAGVSYSTTQKGNIVMANDMYSLMSLARIAGARPLDEAIARDAYYRVQVYEGSSRKSINELGDAIKTTLRAGGVPSQEDIEGFMTKYAHAGGDQKNFSKFWQQQVKQANTSQINQLMQRTTTPYAQYMQTVMGGYKMEDISHVNSLNSGGR